MPNHAKWPSYKPWKILDTLIFGKIRYSFQNNTRIEITGVFHQLFRRLVSKETSPSDQLLGYHCHALIGFKIPSTKDHVFTIGQVLHVSRENKRGKHNLKGTHSLIQSSNQKDVLFPLLTFLTIASLNEVSWRSKSKKQSTMFIHVHFGLWRTAWIKATIWSMNLDDNFSPKRIRLIKKNVVSVYL